MNSDKKERRMVSAEERSQIDRSVLTWLNTYPDRPVDVIKVEPLLPINEAGMAMSSITSAYKTKSYILGGYEAEYSFKVVYRIRPGNLMDPRLEALEELNRLGDWCSNNKPDLGENIRVLEVTPTSQADFYAPYEGGDEDYQIMIKIRYEVNV